MFNKSFGALILCFVIFFSSNIIQAHNDAIHTSFNTTPLGGWRNDGNTIIYTVNSSTKSYTNYVSQTCYQWDWETWVQTPYECGWNVTTYYIQNPYCPSWQELTDNVKNRSGLPRDGTLVCMTKDYQSPSITVNMNGYLNDTWTNQDVVNVNVSAVDDILWLKKTWYIINGVKTDNAWASFSLSFSEEWVYNIIVWAEDNSTSIALDGNSSPVWNIGEFPYVVKIDRHSPIITSPGIPTNTWIKEKPITSLMVVKDNYKWENIELRAFDCPKPINAIWVSPVSAEGKVNGSCTKTISNDCIPDSSFTPNASQCGWVCNNGYTKWPDNLCHINSTELSCDPNLLPKNSYNLDKTDVLVLESTGSVSYWTLPTGIWIDGKFTSNYNFGLNSYTPTVDQCAADCGWGYHQQDVTCISNVKLRCCTQPPLSASVIGTRVDCTLPENQTNVQCIISPLCGWEKEVLWEWNKTTQEWDYTTTNDGTRAWEDWFAAHCWQTFFSYSNWYTCNSRYYLISYDTGKAKSCEPVPIGEWSGQENGKHLCTNKPSKSTYTSNGSNNNCAYVCNANYSGSNCTANTQSVNCSPKPGNSVWNNVSSITQTWNGSTWMPSNTSIYSTQGSNSECRFECAAHYTWNSGSNVCTVDNYTVDFDSNGWTNIMSATVNYNTTITTPSDPTRSWKTFVGWWDNSGFNWSKWNFSNDRVTNDMTLYAKWN